MNTYAVAMTITLIDGTVYRVTSLSTTVTVDGNTYSPIRLLTFSAPQRATEFRPNKFAFAILETSQDRTWYNRLAQPLGIGHRVVVNELEEQADGSFKFGEPFRGETGGVRSTVTDNGVAAEVICNSLYASQGVSRERRIDEAQQKSYSPNDTAFDHTDFSIRELFEEDNT